MSSQLLNPSCESLSAYDMAHFANKLRNHILNEDLGAFENHFKAFSERYGLNVACKIVDKIDLPDSFSMIIKPLSQFSIKESANLKNARKLANLLIRKNKLGIIADLISELKSENIID